MPPAPIPQRRGGSCPLSRGLGSIAVATVSSARSMPTGDGLSPPADGRRGPCGPSSHGQAGVGYVSPGMGVSVGLGSPFATAAGPRKARFCGKGQDARTTCPWAFADGGPQRAKHNLQGTLAVCDFHLEYDTVLLILASGHWGLCPLGQGPPPSVHGDCASDGLLLTPGLTPSVRKGHSVVNTRTRYRA